MKKKSLIIILLFIMARFIISCCDEEGFNFEFTQVDLTFGNEITQGLVNNIDSIQYSELIGQVNLDYTQIACLNIDFSNKLYAFDCGPLYLSVKKIEDIQVISINKFCDENLADSELDVRYDVPVYDMDFNETKATVINILNQRYGKLPDEIIHFKINDTADTNSYHQFAINIVFDDESVISDTTKMIHLYD